MKAQPGRLTLSEDDRRVVAVWAATCAEKALPLFEAQAAGDTRPRDAIEGARAFARGALSIGPARALSAQAHAAAREVNHPAATAAARAAGHAVAVAHMASHALGAPAYAARAAALARPGDPTAGATLINRADKRATAAVRTVLRKIPQRTHAPGALGSLILELQSRLTPPAGDEQ
jgi:hypothetical protein